MGRPMTNEEITRALRRAAVVCIEQQRTDWYSNSVCVADGTYWAADACFQDTEQRPETPELAATFLLFVAEFTDA